jgi:hypothetical protein
MYILELIPTAIMYCGTKMKSEAGLLPYDRLFRRPPLHSTQGHSGCWAAARATCAKAVQERTLYFHERVFILAHYFAYKSFAAVREAFNNAYPDKEVPFKTTIYRMVTAFWKTGSVCLRQVLSKR